MWRGILIGVAIYNLGLAGYLWFAPHAWYERTPGVAMMGPFNLHFIRDVALAYLASAAALGWGAWKRDVTAASPLTSIRSIFPSREFGSCAFSFGSPLPPPSPVATNKSPSAAKPIQPPL